MKSLVASLLVLVFATGYIVSQDPSLHNICQNPAYYHHHSTLCDTYGK